MKHLRNNLVGYLALVVALSGTSYAAVALHKGQVKTRHIANKAVISKKIRNGSVKPQDLQGGVLGTSRVVARSRFVGALEGGTIQTVPLPGAWTQGATELNTFFGEFTFDNPGPGQCGAGNRAIIDIRAGNARVLTRTLNIGDFVSPGTGSRAVLELPDVRHGIFEPGVDTPRTLTVSWQDNCDGGLHFRLTGVNVDVVATR